MSRSEPAPIAVSRRGSMSECRDAGYTVVWVRGEHDIATKVSLVVAIARAAQRDHADVLVDLSEVTFMDASTIGALVGSRDRLRARSQSLELRAPSLPARRVLELCDLAHLVQPGAAEAVHPTGAAAALSTWVYVAPSSSPSRPVPGEPLPAEERQPARLRPTADARPAKTSATIEVDRGGP